MTCCSLALCSLGLGLALGLDVPGGPDARAAEWCEVLGHSLKDAAAAGDAVVAWALLALTYRSQGARAGAGVGVGGTHAA